MTLSDAKKELQRLEKKLNIEMGMTLVGLKKGDDPPSGYRDDKHFLDEAAKQQRLIEHLIETIEGFRLLVNKHANKKLRVAYIQKECLDLKKQYLTAQVDQWASKHQDVIDRNNWNVDAVMKEVLEREITDPEKYDKIFDKHFLKNSYNVICPDGFQDSAKELNETLQAEEKLLDEHISKLENEITF